MIVHLSHVTHSLQIRSDSTQIGELKVRLEAARTDAARSRDALRAVMADAEQASAATLLMERTQNDMLQLNERATAAEAALAEEQRLHSDTRTKLSALEDEAEALRQKRAKEDTQAELE